MLHIYDQFRLIKVNVYKYIILDVLYAFSLYKLCLLEQKVLSIDLLCSVKNRVFKI
jgi:hypothetical protein